MIDFDAVNGVTWRAIELVLACPPLLEECLRILDALESDGGGGCGAAELARLFGDLQDTAEYEERPRTLELLGGCRPLSAIQWDFLLDAVEAVRASLALVGFGWTESVEQSLSD